MKRLSLTIIIVIFISIGVGFILTALGGILVIADPIKRADAIVILSGGGEDRMQEAVSLYEEKYAGTIVLTETGSEVTGFDTLYSFEQRLALMEAGIPPTAILVTAKHVGSTRDEAQAVLNLLGNDNTHDIIVVTDSYHTFRTRLLWREVFRESGISVTVRPARGGWYKSTTWWLSPTGWEATILEYAKLANYLLFQKGE